MALDTSTLETNLKKVFSDMKSAGQSAKDTDFSSGIAKACKTFIEGGEITTVDTGTVTGGVFSGTGSGSMTVQTSLMTSPIDTATTAMKTMTTGGDSTLANAIFAGLEAMIKAGVVETDITGTITSASSSSPASGKAKGTISCTSAFFVDNLITTFSVMNSKRTEEGFNGDDYFASKLARNISVYISSGAVTTAGTGTLSGSVGTGKIS